MPSFRIRLALPPLCHMLTYWIEPRRGEDCLASNGRVRGCVLASRIESSPTSLSESRVVVLHVSFSSFGLQWSGARADTLLWEMNVERLLLLMKDYQAICDASDCDHRNRNWIASVWVKVALRIFQYLLVCWVHPHVSSFLTETPSPHSCVSKT